MMVGHGGCLNCDLIDYLMDYNFSNLPGIRLMISQPEYTTSVEGFAPGGVAS
jgi:hypothetical protein